MATIEVEWVEDWVLEEISEMDNWREVSGVDAYVYRCISGPNLGKLIGNTSSISMDPDEMMARNSLFCE